ncbi:hypothetical protein GCM10007063_08820 [Lentibacillus kapialis]|uniref:Uncharacterized protein n=1 Tax=Lentibacillus kapialis TaxID=340214 RepID=A0A917PR28_9BACI|nr:hypothetical protein [Lentibacillus kapialis]GGJ88525.1 hypothetical protein GCM10007063_08820 [Lentibacillus kapialis]
MGIILMFMLLSTVTPFIFLQLHKKIFAGVQSVLILGMWLYFIQVMFVAVPTVFSITWLMFYASLILAEVAWVMFIIDAVKTADQYRKGYHKREILN